MDNVSILLYWCTISNVYIKAKNVFAHNLPVDIFLINSVLNLMSSTPQHGSIGEGTLITIKHY